MVSRFLRHGRLIVLTGMALPWLASPALAKPSITMMSPQADGSYASRAYLDVEGMIADPRGLKSVEIFLNGRPLERYGTRNIEFRERILPRLSRLNGVTRYPVRFRVPVRALRQDVNSLSLRAENVVGEIVDLRRSFRYQPAKGTIYVAVIGINDYKQSSVPSLKYAENDARAMAKYFRDSVGVPRENIFTLLGNQATSKNIKKLLGVTLQRKAGRDDQIVIFYAGHGVPEFDKTANDPDRMEKYLLPWDGEIDALYATAIPMREVDYLSQRFGSQRVVFLLDTCFSGSASKFGAGARTISRRGYRAVSLDDGFLIRMADAKGKVILTASGINELSQELDSLRHGVFTYYLLEGMKGKADFDSDGVVSVSEIHKYVSAKVPPRTNQEQRPTYFVNDTVTGEIVLGRTSNAAFKFDMRDPWAGAEQFGRLVVQASPVDANIFIDGFRRGTGFINALLRAGRHRVRIEKAGYRSRSQTIRVGRQSLSKVSISLNQTHRRTLPPP